MASVSLYPALVDSYTPAFVGDKCTLNFSLSAFNAESDFSSIHITVSKQSNGENIINDVNNAEQGRYRANKILILNSESYTKTSDGEYSVEILNEDIQNGWAVGEIYKIQIRLSSIEFPTSAIDTQAAWLSQNAGEFSEWSTVSVTKYLEKVNVTSKLDDVSSYTSSSLDFYGTFVCNDSSESLYDYTLQLFDENGILLDSQQKTANVLDHPNEIFYSFKYELQTGHSYKVELEYRTINYYTNKKSYSFSVVLPSQSDCDLDLVLLIDGERDNGRIGLKLSAEGGVPKGSIYRIKRSDGGSNFTVWEDIKILKFDRGMTATEVNAYITYDYFIESGVFYQYGIQKIIGNNSSILNKNKEIVMQEFDSSFLIGAGCRQLKLPFNQTMNSYKYVVSDSNIETIGGKYPFIARNGNLKYRSFPLNGLVSFQMDENELFASKGSLYKYGTLVSKYNNYNINKNINSHMDYIYERKFREEVLEFLQDGKPKLFKSPTEGNILIRLVDVSLSPNQTLNRMISEFSSTAYEIAECTIENYINNKIYIKEEVIV